MPTSLITHTATDPSGTAVGAGYEVECFLMPTAGFRISDSTGITRRLATTTDSSGFFQFALERQSNITPSDSFYLIVIHLPESLGGTQTWSVRVGASNSSLYAALVIPSSSSGLALYLTQETADARYLRTLDITLGYVDAVRDYGADNTGTTSTDVQLQAAINSLSVTGGIVFLRPGVYLIAATLTIPIGVTLIGCSPYATIIQAANGTTLNPMIHFTGSGGDDWSTQHGHFQLSGMAPNGSSQAAVGMKIDKANLKFENIRFLGLSSKAIQNRNFSTSFHNIVITGSASGGTTGAVGISLEDGPSGSNHVVIDHCSISNVTAACIDFPVFATYGTSGVAISNTNLEGVPGSSTTTGIRIVAGANVEGLHVVGCRGEDLNRFLTVADNNFAVHIVACRSIGVSSAPSDYAIELDGGDHVIAGFNTNHHTGASVRLNTTARNCLILGVGKPGLPGSATVAVSDNATDKNRNLIMDNVTNVWSAKFSDGATGRPAIAASATPTVGLFWCTGTPEGALAAGIGSVAFRKDGGAGTSIYVKESGTGNTGWVGK